MTYDLRYEIILFSVVDWSRYKNLESKDKIYFHDFEIKFRYK